MGGGREIPIFISTSAVAGIGTTIANDKRIIPKSNFFILLPPYLALAIYIRYELLEHIIIQEFVAFSLSPRCIIGGKMSAL